MIFRFLLISDEVPGFKREIQINSDDTFYNLHKIIIGSVGYGEKDFVSFFMCTSQWKHKEEITLVERDTYSDVDSFTMKDTTLDEFIEDEGQRLVYVFDPENQRFFYMELREIILGKDVKKALCTQQAGNPPMQMLEKEEETIVVAPVAIPLLPEEEDDFDDLDEDTDGDDEVFYGDDESFDEDELDEDGFDNLDEDGEVELSGEEEEER